MSIDDYLTAIHLTNVYHIRPTLEQVLEAAYRFSNDDLAKASDILHRSQERKLVAFAASPAFAPALERIIETAPDPRNRAIAFLKLGVPMRGLTLPRCVRDLIDADVHAAGGILYVEGIPVDLAGTSPEQQEAVRMLADRGMIPAKPASR